MIELATSLGTAVTNSIRGLLARSGQLLLKSAMSWLAVLSLYRGLRPGQVLQAAIDWSAIPWSVEPVTSWLHDRSTALELVTLFMAFVAISGVRLGSVNWQYTRGPLGLTISIVLLLESDASPLPLIATLSAGLLFAVIRERCLDSGVVVLVSPLLYLLAPLTVTADLLGFRDNWLRSAAAQAPAVPSPVTASGACARPHAIDDADRIHPPKARPTAPSARRKGKPLGFDQARQSWP